MAGPGLDGPSDSRSTDPLGRRQRGTLCLPRPTQVPCLAGVPICWFEEGCKFWALHFPCLSCCPSLGSLTVGSQLPAATSHGLPRAAGEEPGLPAAPESVEVEPQLWVPPARLPGPQPPAALETLSQALGEELGF